MHHDLNPIPFFSSRANTLGTYHVRCCYIWKKERQSDQPRSRIKITPNTLGEEDKHPASKFHSARVALQEFEKPERCCTLLTAKQKAEVTSNTPEIFLNTFSLQILYGIINKRVSGYKGVALVLGKQTLLQDVAQWIV